MNAPYKNPVAWVHILDTTEGIEDNDPEVVLTFSEDNPFGVPGEDYSASYLWTRKPLHFVPDGWQIVPKEPTHDMLAEAAARLQENRIPAQSELDFQADAHVMWDGMLATVETLYNES